MRCARCGMDGATPTVMGRLSHDLCPDCTRVLTGAVDDLIRSYNPDASTVYVQLSKEQVARIRRDAKAGHVTNVIGLDLAQVKYIADTVTDCDDWELGLVDEKGETYADPYADMRV